MNSKPPPTKLSKDPGQNYPEEEYGVERDDDRADDHAGGGEGLSSVFLRRFLDLREGNEAKPDRNNGRNRTHTASQQEPGDRRNQRRQREALIRLRGGRIWRRCRRRLPRPRTHRRSLVGRDPAAGNGRLSRQPLSFLFVGCFNFRLADSRIPVWIRRGRQLLNQRRTVICTKAQPGFVKLSFANSTVLP